MSTRAFFRALLAVGMAVVDFTDDLILPAPAEREVQITGYPEGSWLNFISWSQDAKHIAFTIRSPGKDPAPRSEGGRA